MPRANSADKILGCATQMFAKNGYAGTIMDELAEACELNKATIYYHYKDKSNLYNEVLTRHLTVVVDTVTDAVAKQEKALDKIDAYVKAFSQANSQNSFIVSILMREIASGSELMPDRAKAQMHRMLMIIKQII
ncbi:MAG: TetR/AcrR family transcriptional regulator, partial [Thiovulaceae bacterium]|nr:TetR/AcrR family transcriptional regulator [Sulfurimonadaceae bacterium]